MELQAWKEFTEEAVYKKIFLFGVGRCADYFWENNTNVIFEGIMDNDVRKQGFPAEVFLGESGVAENDKLKISSLNLLKNYDSADVVVLIASTNYYEQMIEELKGIGVQKYFVLAGMEINDGKQSDRDASKAKLWSPADFARVCCQKKIEENKIIFYSFKKYADHGKYITEALLKIRKDLDLVWIVDDMKVEVPTGVRKIYAGNQKYYIREMETAKVWVFNMVVPGYIIKRPEQIYIQTKHWASITLKRFYLDSVTIQNVSDNVRNWKYNSEIMDYIITGSDFDTDSSRRGFGFDKEVWQIGSPRSDALFCEERCRKKVYGFYQIRSEIHTLIYAPTYRFDNVGKEYRHESREIDLDFIVLKNVLERRFGGEWYIILRLHPSVAKESAKISRPDFVIDASNYEDSEELVSACDILISDYSSILFEPAFVKKPVFLFATDKSDYIDREYDLLIDYEALPFPIAESNDELMQNIEQFDPCGYEKTLNTFMEKYGVCEDGHASERAARRIQDLLD